MSLTLIKVLCPRCGAWLGSVSPGFTGVASFYCTRRLNGSKCDTHVHVHGVGGHLALKICRETVNNVARALPVDWNNDS